MYEAGREESERMVSEGVSAIPAKFRAKMDNVIFVVEDEPTAEQLDRQGGDKEYELYGLYEGVPLVERGAGYTNTVPDRITIFQGPIQREAESGEDCARIVAETVWHEVAHHFGLDEERVLRAEKKRAGGVGGA